MAVDDCVSQIKTLTLGAFCVTTSKKTFLSFGMFTSLRITFRQPLYTTFSPNIVNFDVGVESVAFVDSKCAPPFFVMLENNLLVAFESVEPPRKESNFDLDAPRYEHFPMLKSAIRRPARRRPDKGCIDGLDETPNIVQVSIFR